MTAIATLIKLLLIRIVAKRVRGFSFSFKICLADREFSSSSFAKSLCVREKNAISEPETMADAYNKAITMKIDALTSIEGKAKRMIIKNPSHLRP